MKPNLWLFFPRYLQYIALNEKSNDGRRFLVWVVVQSEKTLQ